MPKLTVVAAPASSPLPVRRQPVAGPRERLRALHDQAAGHQRKIKEARSAFDRLTDVISVAVDTKKALTEFDAASAEAAAAWAKQHLNKTPPEVDTGARQKLLVAHAVAQENASASYAARGQFESAINAEERAIKALEIPMQHAIAEILIAEASGPEMDGLREAVAAAVRRQVRLQASFQAIVDIAHSGPADAIKPIFVMMEGFSETLRLAAAPPGLMARLIGCRGASSPPPYAKFRRRARGLIECKRRRFSLRFARLRTTMTARSWSPA
jgi:hypothetical protein